MPPPLKRPHRPHAHVIEQYSVNYVELISLESGCYDVVRIRPDYGTDIQIRSTDPAGFVQGFYIPAQIKAHDRLRWRAQRRFFSESVEVKNVNAWMDELYPFLLIVYDARRNCAYWEIVQNHVQRRPVNQRRLTYTFRIPRSNRLSSPSLKHIRGLAKRAHDSYLSGTGVTWPLR